MYTLAKKDKELLFLLLSYPQGLFLTQFQKRGQLTKKQYAYYYLKKYIRKGYVKKSDNSLYFLTSKGKAVIKNPPTFISSKSNGKKLLVFSHYLTDGRLQCACCHESYIEFLELDHINNDGWIHRKLIHGSMYDWVIRNNFPPGFQLLCTNCNMAKGRYGYCPHNPTKRFTRNALPLQYLREASK